MAFLRPLGSNSLRDIDDMRRVMDTFFHRARGDRSPATSWHGVYPPVNLYEHSDDYVLVAELPGVEPSEIDVSIEGSTVTIRGERRIDYAESEANLHRLERQSGEFRRAFELPATIDADTVEATSKNGVLILRLPKTPEHRPQQITVKES